MNIRSKYENEDKEKDEGGVSMRIRNRMRIMRGMRMRGEYENQE